MEIENAILQDLKKFGKRRIFYDGYGKVLDFKNCKNILEKM